VPHGYAIVYLWSAAANDLQVTCSAAATTASLTVPVAALSQLPTGGGYLYIRGVNGLSLKSGDWDVSLYASKWATGAGTRSYAMMTDFQENN
jgi:hypothetical protein